MLKYVVQCVHQLNAPRSPSSPARWHQPRPVADEQLFVEGEAERAAELVVGEVAVANVVEASEEPP